MNCAHARTGQSEEELRTNWMCWGSDVRRVRFIRMADTVRPARHSAAHHSFTLVRCIGFLVNWCCEQCLLITLMYLSSNATRQTIDIPITGRFPLVHRRVASVNNFVWMIVGIWTEKCLTVCEHVIYCFLTPFSQVRQAVFDWWNNKLYV